MTVVQLQSSAAPTSGAVFINRAINADLTVPADRTLLLRDPILADGVTITLEDGGEMFLL